MKVMCLIVHIGEIAARSIFFSLSLSFSLRRCQLGGGAIRYKIISSVICFSLDYEEKKRKMTLLFFFHASSKHKHLNLIGFFK
jgi:hypothetical protein